ncbi:MAG: hypothetical protein AB7I30_23620 [Isosphaeraceae bacterium]
MSPQTVDNACLIAAAILPVPLILRWNWLGVLLGTLIVWGSLVVAGVLLAELDPAREAGVLDGVWLLFGWLGGLLHRVPIYVVKRVIVWIRRSALTPTKADGS